MNREASTEQGGLFSKVVKFVTNPTTHWSDLETMSTQEGDEDSESRMMLREMIERKRQNDFVRNREFDMLRKLRRQQQASGGIKSQFPAAAAPAPAAGAPAPTDHLNADERERTLKKINELEAQMVSSSWSRKRPRPAPAAPTQVADKNFERTQQLRERAAAEAGNAPLPKQPKRPAAAPNFAPTEPVQRIQPVAPQAAAPEQPAAPTPQPTAPMTPTKEAALQATSPIAVFEGTDDFQVEVLAEARQNPEVEEAAIRFANGDVEGAEQGLLALIGEGGEHQDEVDTWLTLFDLYRASGEQLKFDELSVQFAGRFGRSAPQWSRGANGGPAIPKKITAPAPTPTGQVHWTCPSALGAQSLATLNASIARAASPWRIDWRYLKSIDPVTLPALTEIFNRWADTDGRFKFLGTDVLLQLLEENAPTENRDVDPQWWKTHLALLRVLDEMDEFDMVALNYCITYEVSPPPWMPPKCKYSPMDEEGQTLLPNDFGEEAVASSGGISSSRVPFQDTRPTAAPTRLPDDDGIVRAELEGELLISAADVLAPLAALTAKQAFAIDCRHLQRVDFGAAGDLLNWAMTLHSGGHMVTFHSVNRIVAAFFGVVGLNQAARITLRRD